MKIKHLLLVLAFVAMSVTAKAQTSFSCYYREYCAWDDDLETYSSDCDGYEEASLFVMNENETMFTHTTESTKSTYYVKERNYDEKNEVWTYDVVSDVGNKYYYIFDPKNNEIRVLAEKDDYNTMIRFMVKSIF